MLIATEGPADTEAGRETAIDSIKAADSCREAAVVIPLVAHLMKGREADTVVGTTIVDRRPSGGHCLTEG